MEGVGGRTAVGSGIGERLDDLVKLDDRARPAVGDHQGKRVGVGRARVDEVDAEAVDLGLELGEAIEPRLALAPVVLLGPVAADLLHVGQGNPLGPVVHGLGLRPAGGREPTLQIVELGLGRLDAEGGDVASHGFSCGRAAPGLISLF